MTAVVRILTVSTVDSSPAILLVAPDGGKILVNCGEGCQRSFLETAQRISTVQAVCLTHLSHDSVGGLPGMILTAADAAAATEKNGKDTDTASSGPTTIPTEKNQRQQRRQHHKQTEIGDLPGFDLIGPVGTKKFLHSLRHFMRRDRFCVSVHEGGDVKKKVRPRSLDKRHKKKSKADPHAFGFSIQSFSFQSSEERTLHRCGSKKRTFQGNEIEERPTPSHGQQILSYLFTSPPVAGKFMPDKAAALGVPKGHLFGQLKSGKAVTFVDVGGNEKTVESHEVVMPASPGVAIVVLYYPSEIISKEVLEYFDGLDLSTANAALDLVIHITTTDIFNQSRARDWRQKMGPPVEHVFLAARPSILAEDRNGTPFRSAALGAEARAQVNKDIYHPLPGLPSSISSLSSQNANDEMPPVTAIEGYKVGRPMLEYTLIPRSKKGFTELKVPSDQQQRADARQLAEESGAIALSREILKSCNSDEFSAEVFEGDITFTGTGSAMPCKHRNVTGMCLRAKNGNSMMLDIGEGTVGQLLRMQACDFDNEERSKNVLTKIKVVWISHPHADHHLGILRLLRERRTADPLILMAPTPLFRFLEECATLDATIADTYIKVDCKDLITENREVVKQLEQTLGITSCRAVPVMHCAHSYAVILDGTCFGRLVWSGDCRPSNRLAKAAEGADILIHEATFEDGMEAEAALKRHSTVAEALRVAHQMQAKCTVLTHFSQRYPKIPPTPAAMSRGKMPIVFAFDYMRLTPRTIVAASKLTPALRLLYPEKTNNEEPTRRTPTEAEKTMSVPGLFAQSNRL